MTAILAAIRAFFGFSPTVESILKTVQTAHAALDALEATSVGKAITAQLQADVLLDRKAVHEQVAGLAKTARTSIAAILPTVG